MGAVPKVSADIRRYELFSLLSRGELSPELCPGIFYTSCESFGPMRIQTNRSQNVFPVMQHYPPTISRTPKVTGIITRDYINKHAKHFHSRKLQLHTGQKQYKHPYSSKATMLPAATAITSSVELSETNQQKSYNLIYLLSICVKRRIEDLANA